jgi:enamine deaminase RidA (YjgF/YER057c/UK114 family)
MSTRHINPEGLLRSPAFSQAVVVEQPAKTLYVGGQNGVDVHGKVVGPTVGEQASQALRNLATILESEGASLANIVHWRIAVVEGHAFDEGTPPSSRHGTRPTHRRPSRSTSWPASAPGSSSRSMPSPSYDASRSLSSTSRCPQAASKLLRGPGSAWQDERERRGMA